MSARIMVVEDEEALTTLLRYNLDAEGYDVETVARGDDADTRLRESSPDLVILDWMLPGLSGIELCRRLRARPDTRQVPVIMLTARGEESERVRGLTIGADDYVVKPFSVPELIARVSALLRRARPERVAAVLSYGALEVDREKKRVVRGGPAIASENRRSASSASDQTTIASRIGGLVGDPRVIGTVGQACDGLTAAEEKIRITRIADRPAARLFRQLKYRAPLADRDDVVDYGV